MKVVAEYAKVFADLDMDRVVILDHLMSHFLLLAHEVRASSVRSAHTCMHVHMAIRMCVRCIYERILRCRIPKTRRLGA